MNLTPKQKRFCEEYVLDLNGTQAAKRAGYAESGARTEGARLLANANVMEYVAKLKEKASETLEISHQNLLKKLKNWLESDITVTLGLSREELKQLPLEVKQLITSYKHTSRTYQQGDTPVKEDYVEMKFVSKEKAMEMIAKHIGFFEKDNEQKKPLDFSKLSNAAIQEMLNASK